MAVAVVERGSCVALLGLPDSMEFDDLRRTRAIKAMNVAN